jgi:CRISPR-associated protein Csm3
MPAKLLRYQVFRGTLTCITGLRIGGSKESIEVGGVENTIIRHPITDLPYIPGSSLKGKMRSLLEQKLGQMSPEGEPCGCGRCIVCRVFGPHKNVRHELGPTRILVRDANLTESSRDTLEKAQGERGIMFAEVKTENIVNRKTGVAADRGLRTQERVPADTQFTFEIAVRIFEGDDAPAVENLVRDGLDLLQQDYLGSSGSRGYGKVKLEYTVA